MQRKVLIALFLAISIVTLGQHTGIAIPEKHCITAEERQLYNLISEYRKSKNLPSIEFSVSLSYVAKTHAKDLSINRPDFGGCNPHSWSAKGNWKPCCYARDDKRLDCMTKKPGELTDYRFKAYEVVYSSGDEAGAQDAFNLWKDIALMNDYLLNQGKWAKAWQAIGVGIFGEYACVWFGEGIDSRGVPDLCDSDIVMQDQLIDGKALNHDSVNNRIVTEQVIAPLPRNIIAGKDVTQSGSNAKIRTQDSTGIIHNEQTLYYIIISSTSSEAQAIAEIKKLKDKGFPNALYLKNPTFYRIAVNKFTDETTAYKELEKVKLQYPEAWMLKPGTHK